jgi:hypothetical protein
VVVHNYYRQIVSSIEREIVDLSYHVSFIEEQKKTFSPHIADLIIRVGSTLESILKEKYWELKTEQKEPAKPNPKYDYDCIPYLDVNNQLSGRTAYCTWSLNGLKKNAYCPFLKKDYKQVFTQKEGYSNQGKSNYSWNNAYQTLRHNFTATLPKFGTIEYLLESYAALVLLCDVLMIYAHGSRIFVILDENLKYIASLTGATFICLSASIGDLNYGCADANQSQ